MSDVGKSQTISYIRLTQVTYTVMCSLNCVCEIAGASSEGGLEWPRSMLSIIMLFFD